MAPRFRTAELRSEMRTVRDGNGNNYIVIRFFDNSNGNYEYHVYAEVVAKEAARDIAESFGIDLPPSDRNNVRRLWDIIWREKLEY